MPFHPLLAFALLFAGAPPQSTPTADPVEAPDLAGPLAQAVDRDPGERAAALGELLDLGRPLEEWLAACRGFGTFDPPVPGTERIVTELRSGAAGSVETEVFVHVPRGLEPGTPAPLLLALHGTGGGGRAALTPWVATAEALGMIVVAPSDPGANAGYAYTEAERELTLSALRFARRRFDVDEDRIHLTGVSRGGHLAWDLALRHPDRFASLVPMIGGPRLDTRGQNNLRYLEHLVPVPIRDLQGAGDDPRLLANLGLAFDRLRGWKAADAELILFEDLGHSYSMDAVDWVAFLGSAVRAPRGEERVRLAAGPGPHRNGWLEILETGPGVSLAVAPEVNARRWQRLDEDQRRRVLQEHVDEQTARLAVKRLGRGRFKAELHGVESFRLLLEQADLPARGPVQVRVKSKTRRIDAPGEVRVLLEEFLGRFDRRFLPVAEVRVD